MFSDKESYQDGDLNTEDLLKKAQFSKNQTLEEMKDPTLIKTENGLMNEKSLTSLSSHLQNTKETKTLNTSLRSLKVIKLFFIISVIFTKVIAIICANGIITTYIYAKVDQTNSLVALTELGDLCYVLARLALIVHSFEINIKQDSGLFYFTIDDLNSTISDLQTHTQTLRTQYSD